MTNGLTVWLEALDVASTAWEDQSGVLGEARSAVAEAQALASTLGEGVSASVTGFFTDWVEELTALRDSAGGISETLASTRLSYQVGDEGVEQDMRLLLPWSERTLDPEAP